MSATVNDNVSQQAYEPAVVLDRFTLYRLLGEGGMGQAYLAEENSTRIPVVVKVMHEKYIHDKRFHELFKREMDFLRQFSHPNVVSLIETGVDPQYGPCIVMEYINGEPVGDMLDVHPVQSPSRVGRWLVQLCRALQAAHNRSIIHRDIKPNNIMVADAGTPNETVKVLDFGLAKLAAAPHLAVEELRGTGRTPRAVGTPEYMCPEQMRGNEVDYRGDFYSLGVMLYEMLTGRRPFDHRDEAELLRMHLSDSPPKFADIGFPESKIPAAVEAVVFSCLAKYPMERPSNARELAVKYAKALGYKLDVSSFEEPKPTSKLTISLPNLDINELNKRGESAFKLEAWMPEKIAVLKLKGFLDEMHGEVIESVPGLVRVKLWIGGPPQPPKPPSFLVRMKLSRPPAPPPLPPTARLDFYMEKRNTQENKLTMTVLLHRPDEFPPQLDAKWRSYCDQVINTLCSHLMATRIQKK